MNEVAKNLVPESTPSIPSSNVPSILMTKIFKKGQILLNEGIETNVVLFLKKGFVKIYMNKLNGAQSIVQIKGPNEYLNLINIYDQDASLFSVEPISNVVVDIYRKNQFLSALKTNPDFLFKISESIAKDYYESLTHNSILSCSKIRERLLELFRLFSKKFGTITKEGVTIPFITSRETLALLLGVSYEALIRELASLKKQSLIVEEDEKIFISSKLLELPSNVQRKI